ncbi:LOW QUALITY PROTEIN: hypothetical protein PHPALM_7181 [Phytophthora palmivora]|uniref:Uncharacterized protein n=1 Tax=Phytophthora palmivora TaxID=4796 RepID=A0A2P4YD98_9STRA|nr:LOW QUALITY PROTEIN: hypothetical protein PHPALM_7181 [Phytophthora palmivora]
MKLPHNASAVLTLGPKLTKEIDARCRTYEATRSILQTSEHSEVSALTAIDVLNWVVDNTKTESVRGLLEWASSGIHYRKTQLDRGAELVDEDWSLETLYQEKMTTDKIARIIQAQARCGFEGVDDSCKSVAMLGRMDSMMKCVLPLTLMNASENFRWKRSRKKKFKMQEVIKTIGNVMSVEDFIRQRITPDNFAAPTSSRQRTSSPRLLRRNGTHERILTVSDDVMVIFDNGQVLLVSECEADRMLELI